MVFERRAVTVGSISTLTIVFRNSNFIFIKLGYMCHGFSLVNDDGIYAKTIDLGDVHVIYVKTNITHHILNKNLKVKMKKCPLLHV